MSKFLEIFDKQTKEIEPLIKEGAPDQWILSWKISVSKILENRDKEKYYFVRNGEKFGFSELLVNQLMKFSYEQGIKSGKYSNIDYKERYENLVKEIQKLNENLE